MVLFYPEFGPAPLIMLCLWNSWWRSGMVEGAVSRNTNNEEPQNSNGCGKTFLIDIQEDLLL